MTEWMKPSIHKEVNLALRCTAGHQFVLVVERREDVTMSHINADGKDEGYAMYRDRSFIECGYCKAYCRVLPGAVNVEVKYKPDDIARKNQA